MSGNLAIASLFGTVADFTFGSSIEGGYSTRTDDSGNYYLGHFYGSNHGISAPVAAAWLRKHEPGTPFTAEWMKSLSVDTARAIAKDGFWDSIELDGLAIVSAGLSLSVFDHGYSRGPNTAGALFQAMIGLPEIDPVTLHYAHDGVIGASTLAFYATADLPHIGSHLNKDSAASLQKYVGVKVDGWYGPKTNAACIGHGARNIVSLYALHDVQRFDYEQLPAVTSNPGWLTRTDKRLAAALELEKHV